MRLTNLFALLLIVSGLAQADLEILSPADSPSHADALNRMEVAAAGRVPSDVSIPSLEQLIASIESSKRTEGFAASAPSFKSPFRLAIEQLGCHLSSESPSGVELIGGGFNGVMSVYECGTRYVATYEYTYEVPHTLRVVVIDEDFARHADSHTPLTKTNVITVGERRMTTMRWLNRRNEVRYEVYAEGSYSGDQTFEKNWKFY